MHRRDVLRSAALGAAALPFASSAVTAASQASYEPLGSVPLRGTKEVVVGDDGTTAYAATTDGFATVDVSDPANPEVLSEARALLADRENGPLSHIYDVKVDGDTLIVVGPANATREATLQGMAVYDVSDPSLPERVGFHETDYPIHNAYLQDGVAYLTANDQEKNPVVVVDVSGDAPEEIARWSIVDHDEGWRDVNWFVRSNHDLYVHGDTLYVAHWDAGTWLVDVSDPASPEYVNDFGHYALEDLRNLEQPYVEGYEVPGNAHYVAVNDDATLLASGAEAWDVRQTEQDGGPGGIDLWDVSDPQNPEKLSFVEPPATPDATRDGTWTTSHNFDFHGDRLYTSWYRGGVKIHDVSDPANPEELAWWRQPEHAMFWTAQYVDDASFVAGNMTGSGDYPTGVYTFPNRAGEQPNPPEIGGGSTTTTTTQSTTTTTRSTTTTTATTQSTTTDGSSGGTTTAAGGDATTDGGESGGSSPGFGAFAGLAAVSGAALAAWRRRRD
ncbi:MAG: LVIVD repeat-containing protein [Halobacterium sp.]